MSAAGPKGKTIDGLSPGMPAREAARWTLHVRLLAAETLLESASGDGVGDERTIHQLRVSTRRAASALRVFRAWFPKKRRRRVERALRGVRRTAGEARMCDVQIRQFESLLSDVDRSLMGPIGVVIGRIAESRRGAGEAVRLLSEDESCGIKKLGRLRKMLDRSIGSGNCRASRGGKWKDMALADLALDQIPTLLAGFEAVGSADLGVVDNVHALRIAGKRVRYAVEIFECCFEPKAHKELLKRLADFQDHLGDMNDLWEMRHRVDSYAGDHPSKGGITESLERLSSELSGRFDRAHREFITWWGEHGIESIVGDLGVPGRPAENGRAAGAAEDGTLARSVDPRVEDGVRHKG